MKNAIVAIVIITLIIWGYFTIHLSQNPVSETNQTVQTTNTENPTLPEADYSEAVIPSDALPEPEDVSVIDEEH